VQQSNKPSPQPMVDPKYGSAEQMMALPPPKLLDILKDPGASTYAKAKACQRLAVVGGRTAVQDLGAMLSDAQLSHYARTALETIPHQSADEVLREALTKVKGLQLAGIINSVGFRRDSRAIPQLAVLRYDTDPEVVKAADAALARIRPAL
jgi:hypothetical protein